MAQIGKFTAMITLHFQSAASRDLGTRHRELVDSDCFLDIYLWSALANHHETCEESLILLELQDLMCCFHLYDFKILSLVFQVWSFYFFIVDLPRFATLIIYKRMEESSSYLALLRPVIHGFLKHDQFGD